MKFRKKFTLTIRAINLIREMMPKFIVYIFFRGIVCSISPYINLYFSGKIVDAIISHSGVSEILSLVIILVISTFVFEMSKQFLWGRIRVNQLVFDSWEEYYLNKKGLNLDYEQIEDLKLRELRQKIIDKRDMGGLKQLILQIMAVINNLFSLVIALIMLPRLFLAQNGSTLTFTGFLNKSMVAIIFLIMFFLFTILTIKITQKGAINIKRTTANISSIQKFSRFYIDEYLDDIKVGKDIRIYKQQNLILSSLNTIFDNYFIVAKKFRKAQISPIIKREILINILKGVLYIYIGQKAISGSIGVGSIVEFTGIVTLFLDSATNITKNITEIYFNNKYLEDLFEYIDVHSNMNIGDKKIENLKMQDICFENVSFKYSNSDKNVLNRINLKFRYGEKIAIVGMNGSGKTTFIKLLCRLYDPKSGKITLNGNNIKDFNYEEYLSLFAIVFQDYKLFSFSVANNISGKENYNEEQVCEVLRKVGALDKIKTFSAGIDTNIFKDIDSEGIEISGGEAQKIAIARALYKNSPILIMDEPTAALDPLAEAEIYEMINATTNNKLTFFISHRLSSCRFCDRIIVFDKGEVVQEGSHDDLIDDVNGKYFELWNAQAQYYKRGR